ncbi:hypothetical protein SAMD00019534_004820 [Acytostelium subglobosum LB1]|uniref:hypothetical protein n=1 Tax=Acytostelium subglobosum LB1 TaxID=1410327 RepID=UPI0006450967|nr:hypothetical protein SAMD00019534_004820 [Acytostelium subglobosum LB1]GAM17307.1 hypothetical protein SAMD00019534_004820 [Acytostelium subglobosum LB1]|eukprot:XP_012759369.1 hypothetical protein SAMD00019534_004820 [Acytostelium subglobosum LB1]
MTGGMNAIVPGALPASLKVLILEDAFNQPLMAGTLPSSLTKLDLNYNFQHEIPASGDLPSGLLRLSFGHLYNAPLMPGVLPPTLIRLKLGACFNREIRVGLLPSSLQSLKFGFNFNQHLPPGCLPQSLKHLTLGWEYIQLITEDSLPASLTSLCCCNRLLMRHITPNTFKHCHIHTVSIMDNGTSTSIVIPDSIMFNEHISTLKVFRPLSERILLNQYLNTFHAPNVKAATTLMIYPINNKNIDTRIIRRLDSSHYLVLKREKFHIGKLTNKRINS